MMASGRFVLTSRPDGSAWVTRKFMEPQLSSRATALRFLMVKSLSLYGFIRRNCRRRFAADASRAAPLSAAYRPASKVNLALVASVRPSPRSAPRLASVDFTPRTSHLKCNVEARLVTLTSASRTNKRAFAVPARTAAPTREAGSHARTLARCKATNVWSACGQTGARRGLPRNMVTPDRPTRARPGAGRARARTPIARVAGRARGVGCARRSGR